MTEQTWPEWYAEQFERAAEGLKPQLPPSAPDDLRLDLDMVSRLARLDLSAESRIRSSLFDRLSRVEETPSSRVRVLGALRRPAVSLRLSILAFTLLAALILTHSPVLAAFGRWLGYGYLSQTGFIRLDQTLLLPGPLLVEGPNGFRVSLVVAGQDSTRIWISGGPVLPAGLRLESGLVLAPDHSETAAGGTTVWFFDPLPADQNRPILLLQDGQRIPLGLIPAGEVGLAPTAVTLPTRTPSSSPTQPCLAGEAGSRLCIRAAQIDNEGLHVLVEVKPAPGTAAPNLKDWNLTLSTPGGAPVVLQSILPGQDPGVYALLFAPFPLQDGNLTLHTRSLTMEKSDDLTFTLPKMRPSLSPTPRVIQTPSNQAVPALTPVQN